MQTIKRYFLAALLFVTLTIVGQRVLSSLIRYRIKSLYDMGAFISWKKLETSLTFEEITDAIPTVIWARASDGEIYVWDSSYFCSEEQLCNHWAKNDSVPQLSEYTDWFFEPLLSHSSTCNGLSNEFTLFKNPSGKIVNCYFTMADETNMLKDSSYYVLLSDGTIWSWTHKSTALITINYLSDFIGFAASTIFFILIVRTPKNAEQKRLNIQAVKNLLLLLFLSACGIVLGYKIGGYIVNLQTSGSFVSWKLLDGPYKFEEIVDANSSVVWAKTADGKLYSWDCQSQDKCKWVGTENVPADAHETYQGMGEQPLNKDDICPPHYESFSLSEKPHGKIVECALGWYMGGDAGFGGYFALLEDGTIWSWRHTHDVFNATMFFIPLSVCVGLIISIAIFVITMIIVTRNSKKQLINIERDNS